MATCPPTSQPAGASRTRPWHDFPATCRPEEMAPGDLCITLRECRVAKRVSHSPHAFVEDSRRNRVVVYQLFEALCFRFAVFGGSDGQEYYAQRTLPPLRYLYKRLGIWQVTGLIVPAALPFNSIPLQALYERGIGLARLINYPVGIFGNLSFVLAECWHACGEVEEIKVAPWYKRSFLPGESLGRSSP